MRARPRLRSVPLYLQPQGSMLCGAAVARMVLAAHGRKLPLSRLVREMRVLKTDGVSMPRMGSWFLQNGFDVTIVAAYDLFPPSYMALEPSELRRRLSRWARRNLSNASSYKRGFARSLKMFIELGGKIELRPVTLADMRSALRRREPPIVSLDSAALRKCTRHWYCGHYVVPTAIWGRQISINDPSSREFGRTNVSADHFMFACYRWRAGALFVRPTKRIVR